MAIDMRAATEVEIPAGGDVVHGDLAVPDAADAMVVFAHGSGSSRFSERNRAVAAALGERRQATLLMDLLTRTEDRTDQVTRQHRFDIDLLAGRLVAAVDWIRGSPDVAHLPIGLFGASTGAAAAIVAAARLPGVVGAVVSRGGRPDLAGDDALGDLAAPTLLIVGGADEVVVGLNEEAARLMRAPHELILIEGATHLFEESGALEQVAGLAADWFATHLLLEPMP